MHTFSEFLSFIYITSKLSISSNHAEYPKGLAPCYMLPFFTILKSPYPMDQPACLEKIISVQGKSCFLWKTWAFEAPIGLSSYRSNHENYKDPLRLNKPLNKPLTRLPKTFVIDVVCYTKKDLQLIIQIVF